MPKVYEQQPVQHNVLFVSNSAKIGGGNRSLVLIANGIKKRGGNVYVAVPNKGEMYDLCLDSGFSASIAPPNLSKNPLVTLQNLLKWHSLIKKCKANIVHVNGLLNYRSVILAASLNKIPTICHIRFTPSDNLIQWAGKMLPKPKAFIFCSQNLKKSLDTKFEHFFPHIDRYAIHNAVDLSDFYPSHNHSTKPIIGILANLVPVKGHIDFLNMAKILTDLGIDAEYHIIGEDVHKSGFDKMLEDLTNELNIQQRVKFLGHQRDVTAALNRLSLLVVASHEEPFGRCVIEGMACALPVVATNVGGIPEIVIPNKTGLLVPKNDPKAMAESVSKILNNPQLKEELATSGRTRVENIFSEEHHLKAILKVYAKALKQH